MADIKISELTQVSALNNGDLVEVSQVNALAPSGYTSLKASMTDLGKKVNSDIEYTTDLADFTDKTITGAIKETAKGKNVADEYDDTQTYDKGDVVIYKNTLYICTTNNTTGTFDPSKWTATTIDNVIGDLSQLTTSVKSSLVGAVNEVNGAISYKEYVVQIGTSLWNGVYYAETNVATDVSNYGEILSALVIDESEQSDFSSHTNRACFCQVITPNIIRLYSPQASNASGHYVKYRVTFSANAVNRT